MVACAFIGIIDGQPRLSEWKDAACFTVGSGDMYELQRELTLTELEFGHTPTVGTSVASDQRTTRSTPVAGSR